MVSFVHYLSANHYTWKIQSSWINSIINCLREQHRHFPNLLPLPGVQWPYHTTEIRSYMADSKVSRQQSMSVILSILMLILSKSNDNVNPHVEGCSLSPKALNHFPSFTPSPNSVSTIFSPLSLADCLQAKRACLPSSPPPLPCSTAPPWSSLLLGRISLTPHLPGSWGARGNTAKAELGNESWASTDLGGHRAHLLPLGKIG